MLNEKQYTVNCNVSTVLSLLHAVASYFVKLLLQQADYDFLVEAYIFRKHLKN